MGTTTTTIDISNSFKRTEKCLLPEDWDVVTLEDVCTKAINGGTPSTEVEKYWEGDIPWITGADIINQKVSKIRRYITEEAVRNSSTNVIPKGNLLVVTRTGVGKLAIASFDVAVSQDFTGIIPNEKIKTEFLFWLLNNSVNYFLDLTQGTSINGITRKDLMGFIFPRPTLPEQHQIAEILSTVDRAIEQTEAIIAKQQRIKTGLMQDLLTRGIDEHGNIRSEETHEFKDSPLGGIPVEWDVMKLSEATSKLITYGIVQPGGHVPDGVPFVQTKDITRGQLDSGLMDRTSQDIHSAYERSAIHTGDIVIGIRASVGFVAEVPKELNGTNISRGVARLSPSKRLLGRYLFWIVQATHIQNSIKMEIKGSTYPEITLPALRNILIQIPNPEEQNQIAKSLDLSANQIRQTEFRLTKLRSLKTALMQDLLTGKKRVTPLLSESQEVSA